MGNRVADMTKNATPYEERSALLFRRMIPSVSTMIVRTTRAVCPALVAFFLAVVPFTTRAQIALPPNPDPRLANLALPSAQQLVWHDYELGMFIHFGPSTFLDYVIDWPASEYRAKEVRQHQMPDKPEHQFDPKHFNPTKLDTDQWVAAAEAMGARYIVMVAKHHGGFCVWQTGTSDYGVRNTPWKNGSGDIMAELSPSCRKRGMALGVYLSPQDHVHGAAGGGRCRTPEDQERYNGIYRQQLTELLTRYGKIAEVWFDGGLAVPVGDIIRKHAADAVVFQGPEASIRWVGNEKGFAPYPCWNAVSTRTARSGTGTARNGTPDGTVWMPNECDTKIRGQWHWASDKTDWGGSATLKSLKVLMDTYYRSVGHGAVLLLNHSPDTTGRITEADFKRGAELGAEVRRRFGRSLAETDGHGTTLELDLGKSSVVDHVITMEDIAHGERIRSYAIEGYQNGDWVRLCTGTSVGHKKIDPFSPVRLERIRLRVITSVGSPVIRKFAAYDVGQTSRVAPAATSQRIELEIVAGSKADQQFDLSGWIQEPGQYELILRTTGGNPLPTLRDLKLLIDGAVASQYLTAQSGQTGRFNLNITVTRSWPAGSIVLRHRANPKRSREP